MKKVGFLVLGLSVLVGAADANAQFIRRPIVVPVYPVYPVQPVYPVVPVRPIVPVRPVVPVVPVVPVYPVYPIYPVFPVYPVYPVVPVYPAYGRALAAEAAPAFRYAGQGELTTGVNVIGLSGDHADRIQLRVPAACGIEIESVRALEGRATLPLGGGTVSTVDGVSVATYTVSRSARVDRLEIKVGKVREGSCSVEVRTAAH